MRRARDRPPVLVHGLPATLAALKQHILNGVIWPDFTRLPEPEAPVLALTPIEVGQVVQVGRHAIEVLPALHTVPAVGYAASVVDHPERGAWVFTGDTGPNPALWERLGSMRVASLVIETAFRDDEETLAQVSQHLCPRRLREELTQLREPTDVYITHIKPGEVDAVMSEIHAQTTPHRIRALMGGTVITLGGAA